MERLRNEHKQPMRPITKGRLLNEAADEIEQLSAFSWRWTKPYSGCIFDFSAYDVLPSYDIASEVGRNDPELADADPAVLL